MHVPEPAKNRDSRLQCIQLTHVCLGLIFSLTILIAAGLAVYDNPQVRQWVDSSRRKIALALHSLGDEIGPNSNSRESAPDASTREDEGPEAVERRRKARQEILERARTLEEKRRARQETARERLRSFDTLVDKEGALIDEREVANTTSTEIQSTFNEQDLRKRNTESNAAALGSAFANPFTDELHTDVNRGQEMVSSGASICSHTPTLHESQVNRNTASSPQPQLLTDTDEISNHPSEALVDLTPTTSTSSAVHAEIPDHSNRNSPPQNPWSVREWAESTAPAFYSPTVRSC